MLLIVVLILFPLQPAADPVLQGISWDTRMAEFLEPLPQQLPQTSTQGSQEARDAAVKPAPADWA